MTRRRKSVTPQPRIKCVSCGETKSHRARRLCNACYNRHNSSGSLDRFAKVRIDVTPRERYESWVASGLTPSAYARELGIWVTSLVRVLRVERERRDRLGLPWLTGWRRAHGGRGETERNEYESACRLAGAERHATAEHDEVH